MSIIYRASELGNCTRRLLLKRVGFDPMPPPAKYEAYFAAGNTTEDEVKADYRERGWAISAEQGEINLNITDEIIVQGHLDGIIQNLAYENEMMRVLEVKRMNPAYWNIVREGGWHVDGLMTKYRWQVSAYMLGTKLECMLIARNGETGEDHILYAEEPFHSFNDIAARVLVIEGRARTFQTQDDTKCDQADYPCPFYYTHEVEDDERAILDGEEAETVEALGVAYQRAADRERAAKDDKAAVGEQLRSLLGDRDRIAAGSVHVTRFTGSRTVVDWERIESDTGNQRSEYESKRSNRPSIRVTVTGTGGE